MITTMCILAGIKTFAIIILAYQLIDLHLFERKCIKEAEEEWKSYCQKTQKS